MTGFVRRLAVGLACAALVVATGCGGEDSEPDASPTSTSPTPSEAPSESESPAELEMPEEAKKKTQAGAEAFLQYWVELVHQAIETGDTTHLKNVSGADCESCQSANEWLEEFYSKGGSIEADPWQIKSTTELKESAHEDIFFISAVLRFPPEKHHTANGKVKEIKASKNTHNFELKWQGNRWSLDQYANLG